MFKFEMPGVRFECEKRELFQVVISAILVVADEETAQKYVVSLVRYEGKYIGQKINQIKEIRNITGWGLAASKNWQEGMTHAEHVTNMDTVRELQRAGFTVTTTKVGS